MRRIHYPGRISQLDQLARFYFLTRFPQLLFRWRILSFPATDAERHATWSVVYSHNGFFHFGRSDYRCAFDFHFFCAQNGQNGCHRGSGIRSAFPCSGGKST